MEGMEEGWFYRKLGVNVCGGDTLNLYKAKNKFATTFMKKTKPGIKIMENRQPRLIWIPKTVEIGRVIPKTALKIQRKPQTVRTFKTENRQ